MQNHIEKIVKSYENDEYVLDELWYWIYMSPVFIYWIVIPIYRWIMKGR